MKFLESKSHSSEKPYFYEKLYNRNIDHEVEDILDIKPKQPKILVILLFLYENETLLK